MNNIDDAAPDYLMSGLTPDAMISALRAKHPKQVKALPDLTFVEQYDPDDVGPKAGCQPYAFVADRVVEADLSIDVGEAMNKSISVKEWDAMVDLRDELAKDEKVGWYVVYNGDVDRDGRVSYDSSKVRRPSRRA